MYTEKRSTHCTLYSKQIWHIFLKIYPLVCIARQLTDLLELLLLSHPMQDITGCFPLVFVPKEVPMMASHFCLRVW